MTLTAKGWGRRHILPQLSATHSVKGSVCLNVLEDIHILLHGIQILYPEME